MTKTSLFTIWILFLTILISCSKEDAEKVSKLTRFSSMPVEKARDLVFTFSDSGILKAKIFTPYSERYNADRPYIVMPKGVKAIFYDYYGNPNASLTADWAIRYTLDHIVEVKKNVVVVNLKGDTLTTEHLIWDETREKIYSEAFVKVKTADEIINSDGFESDPYFSHYEFKNIRGIISLKEQPEADEEDK